MFLALIGIGRRHSGSSFLQMPMPLLVRFFLLCIIVAFALLLIQQLGKYMRRRHVGQAPW